MSYQLPEDLAPLVQRITPVGSRVTCNPAPTDTDADYLVYVLPENARTFIGRMACGGFEAGGSRVEHNSRELEDGDEAFMSFTQGEVNLIVTSSYMFQVRFLAATGLAAKFNLLDKAARIELFQAVIYGNYGALPLPESVYPQTPSAISLRFPAACPLPPAAPRTWEEELDDLL